MNTSPVTVSLISMPFKDLRHPPIQLGILQSCLRNAGISSRCHPFELQFMEYLHRAGDRQPEADRLTIAQYQDVAHRDFVVQLGDWIFKVPPFAEPSADDPAYLDYLSGTGVPDETIGTASRMKELVPGFLASAVAEVLDDRPRIVGFSTVFQQNVASLVLARMLKIEDPSIVIVFGGGNCDGPMGAALLKSFPWLDIVVRGEGEKVFVDVAREVLAREKLTPREGLCYRADGEIAIVQQARGPQVGISEVPTPVYDDYFAKLEASPLRNELWPEVAILFESSRGCWWGEKSHCTFCGLNGSTMKFRAKAAPAVAAEMLELASRYKVLNFVAVDDIVSLEHVRELFPILKESRFDFEVFYETKANLTKDQLRLFRDAGVTSIQPGIESLSTPILRLMGKGVSAYQNLRLLKWCAELGISAAWNLLSGFPGESPDEYRRMAELIPSLVHLEPPNFTPIQVHRFSPYFERPSDFGLTITGPSAHYKFLYPVDADMLSDLAYTFDHVYADGRQPSSYTKPAEEAVEHWRQMWPASRASLFYRRGPGFLVVFDRRDALDQADYRFDGAEADIYLACDEGATPGQVHELLLARGHDAIPTQEIREYLDELVESRLVYREGNRYLALAVSVTGASRESDPRQPVNDRKVVHIEHQRNQN